MSKERWNACKWCLNQLRIITDNKFDREAEVTTNDQFVSHKAFFELVRPAFWPQACPNDIEAVFKRSVIIVNTEKWVYIRRATEERVNVPRVPSETRYFLKESCLDKLKAYKEGSKAEPLGFVEDKAWEAQWMRERAEHPERPLLNIVGPSLHELVNPPPAHGFMDFEPLVAPPAVPWKFENVTEEEVQMFDVKRKVKRELEDTFHENVARLAKQMKGNFINVDAKRARKQAADVGEDICDTRPWFDAALQNGARVLSQLLTGKFIDADTNEEAFHEFEDVFDHGCGLSEDEATPAHVAADGEDEGAELHGEVAAAGGADKDADRMDEDGAQITGSVDLSAEMEKMMGEEENADVPGQKE